MRPALPCAVLCAFVASPVAAEVTAATANGFEMRQVRRTAFAPADAYARFVDVARWWNPEHTYSGKAENLSLRAVAGGCFCETLADGGGVEHLRVAMVMPGKRMVLAGALGPLLYDAVAGSMDVVVKPAEGGSEVTITYRVAGFAKGGADKLAPIVDKVLGEQADRLAASMAARP